MRWREGQRKRLRELSAIYLASALLAVALVHLTVQQLRPPAAVAVDGGVEQDAFPELYAPGVAEYREPEENTVYFTFDDGPSHNTEALLDLLREEGVPATFFVTGQTADQPYAGELLRRILEEGHSLGLHSYTHDFSQIYASPEAYLSDLDRLRVYIEEETGYQPDILRFPGGSATINAPDWVMEPLMREINRRGFAYYDWNVVSGDDTITVYPAEELAGNILQHRLTREVEPIQLKKPGVDA